MCKKEKKTRETDNPHKPKNGCNYVPHNGPPKYIKQKLTGLKGEINGNTIIVWLLFLIPHSQQWIDRPDKRINK